MLIKGGGNEESDKITMTNGGVTMVLARKVNNCNQEGGGGAKTS